MSSDPGPNGPHRPTVLIIDDDPAIHELLGVLLEEPFELIHADDPFHGISKCLSLHPDVILLDICMPAIDGFEVCTRLKEFRGTRDIPIVFMTASSDKEYLIKALDLGAIEFITKPLLPDALIGKLRRALNAPKPSSREAYLGRQAI